MSNKIDRLTKNFIITKLQDTIKTILGLIEKTNNIDDRLYEAYLDYAQSVLRILLKDDMLEEYQLLLKDIELIKKQNITNHSKLLAICGKLIDLGMNLIDHY